MPLWDPITSGFIVKRADGSEVALDDEISNGETLYIEPHPENVNSSGQKTESFIIYVEPEDYATMPATYQDAGVANTFQDIVFCKINVLPPKTWSQPTDKWSTTNRIWNI